MYNQFKEKIAGKWILLFLSLLIVFLLVLYIRHPGTGNRTQTQTPSETETVSGTAAAEEASPGNAAFEATPGNAGLPPFSEEDLLEQSLNLNRSFRPWYNYSGLMNRYKRGYRNRKKQTESTAPSLRPVHKDLIYLATDLHYYPSSMTDYGEAFQDRMDIDDGKDIADIGSILDSWIDTVIEERPATVILSGDLTYNGESIAHEELTEKLKRLTDEGIQVLAIPGNHDINNPSAAFYYGSREETATSPDADGFLSYYHAYGYDQAAERDGASLSYLYKIDDTHWLMMLDSAIYSPVNEVEGRIRPDTLSWMKKVLEEADDAGAQVIPVAHHNLLSESRLYTTLCTLDNNQDVISLLEKHHVKLWLSGHLHLQRIKNYLPEPGADRNTEHITEAVTASFAMYPFPYGVIRLGESGALSYRSAYVNAEDAVKADGLERFRSVITKQAARTIGTIPDDMKETMADSYAELLKDYVAGIPVDETEYRSETGYRLFTRFMNGSAEMKNVEAMLADTKKDNRTWHSDSP